MNRRIDNTTPTTVNDHDDRERTRIQPVNRLPLEQSFHQHPHCGTSCKKSPMGEPQSLTALMSQAGSKRKASAASSPQKEEESNRTTRLNPGIRNHRWFAFAPPETPLFRLNQSTGTATKDDQESETIPNLQELGYESTSHGKPKVSVDDLDGTVYHIPCPPRKYRRRNSFFIHKDSKKHSTILHNIQMASFMEGDNLSDNKATFTEVQDGGEHRLRRANSLDETMTTSSPARANREEDTHSRIQQWGNATWANPDDTNWYSELSSLSFLDSSPILPPATPPAAVSYSEETEEESCSTTCRSTSTMTNTSSMVPPAPRQPLQRATRKLSNGQREPDES
jgi:hypothetical protein